MSVRAKQQRRQRAAIDRRARHASSRWSVLQDLGIVGARVFHHLARTFSQEEDRRAFEGITNAYLWQLQIDLAAKQPSLIP